MNITYNEAKKIFNTLPIGYYLGKKINATIDETDESYYDPMSDEIHVGFNTINRSLDSLTDESKIETDVRTLLYHEVSHAILTPDTLKMNWQTNVFEDERIETILNDFYMNVNFKEFCVRANNYNPNNKVKNANEFYFDIVRFRNGPKQFVDRVDKIITETILNPLNAESYNIYNYKSKVEHLYNDIINYWNDHNQSQNNDSQQNQENNNSSGSSNDSELNKSNKTSENTNSNNSSSSSNSTDNSNVSSEEIAKSICDKLDRKLVNNVSAKSLIDSKINEFEDTNMYTDFSNVIDSIHSTSKKNGSAINSYSGIFDPRSVIRNDYKYFVRQNRLGSVKQFAKIHLNLFIDNSGSFRRSEDKVNKMLHALSRLEKVNHDFTFDLITCGISQRIMKKDERKLSCHGCNLLDNLIFDQFKQVQKTNEYNYNIVMFDGDAFSAASCSTNKVPYHENFSAFNNSHTTIISDSDNEIDIRKYASSAKIIITDDYANELYSNVLIALKNFAR